MKIRAFLLAGATVLAAEASAQAADLGAEPVDYVKICDAFGKGFYYAPGTDTCIRIGGYVRFEIRDIRIDPYSLPNHRFYTEATVNVTASSITEYGALVGFVQILASDNGPGSSSSGVFFDEGTLSLGPLLAGFTWSAFNPYSTPTFANLRAFTGLQRMNQVRLAWKTGDVAFTLATEDYRGRVTAGAAGDLPDLVAALDAKFGMVGLHVGAGYGSRTGAVSSTWGASGTVSFALDAIAKGDVLLIGANYSAGGEDWVRGGTAPAAAAPDGSNYYSIYGHFLHWWTSQFSTVIAAAWTNDRVGGGVVPVTEVTLNGTYRPVSGFAIGAELDYNKGTTETLTGRVRFQRSFP
jgi:hypothetical protein